MLYLTGDTHANILERFSYKNYPFLQELTKDDVVVVLGDVGLMWPLENDYATNKVADYIMRQLESKPFKIIFLLGNHDNYDYAETLPEIICSSGPISIEDGYMRPVVIGDKTYKDRYIVDSWAVMNLSGYHCLLCAHAKSHDIEHLYEQDDKEGIAAAKKRHEWYRVVHESWWPQEELDITAIEPFYQKHKGEHFDAILTHDCPGIFCGKANRPGEIGRLRPTRQERNFDTWLDELDFDVWAHGHMHYDWFPYTYNEKKLYCLYHGFNDLDGLKQCGDIMTIPPYL